MKKLVALAILALTSLTSFAAGQVGIEYERQFLTGGSFAGQQAKNIDLNTVGVAPGLKVGNTLVDVKLANTTSVQDVGGTKLDAIANYEARVKQTYALGNGLSVTARAGVGYLSFRDQSVKYYFIEPGVEYAVAPAVTVNAAYRYTNDFESKVGGSDWLGHGNRITGGVDYAFTKEDAVGLKVYRQTGDTYITGVNVGYVRSF